MAHKAQYSVAGPFKKYFADVDLGNCLSFLFAFLWPLSGVMDTTYDMTVPLPNLERKS